jgi:hypothetical protein
MYTDRERSALRHSLGNLVPLSKAKNSSFQNQCFADKVERAGSTVGFRYGSYSENEVALSPEWTAREIFIRGMRLLDFLEVRWRVSFGSVRAKATLLGLVFVPYREQDLRSFREAMLPRAKRHPVAQAGGESQ